MFQLKDVLSSRSVKKKTNPLLNSSITSRDLTLKTLQANSLLIKLFKDLLINQMTSGLNIQNSSTLQSILKHGEMKIVSPNQQNIECPSKQKIGNHLEVLSERQNNHFMTTKFKKQHQEIESLGNLQIGSRSVNSQLSKCCSNHQL